MNCRSLILFLAAFLGLMCPGEALCQQSGTIKSEPGAQFSSPANVLKYTLPQIMDSLRHYAQERDRASLPYEAHLKVKSQVDVLHKGVFPSLMPYLNKAKLNEGSFTQEYIGKLEHTEEDSTKTSLTPLAKENSLIVKEFTQHITSLSHRINLYSQYMFGNIYSPLAYLSGKYYNFSLDSMWNVRGENFCRIGFSPKISNYKFVEGYMTVAQGNWSVRSMKFSGNVEFVDYCNEVQMGSEGSGQELFPVQLDVKVKGAFIGTRINGECSQEFSYTRIGDRNFLPDSSLQLPQVDTASIADTKHAKVEFFVKDHSLDLKEKGYLHIAPLVSPLLFHYSTHSGLSYTQKLKYTRQLKEGRMFRIEPLIGYNFKYKEFYWAGKGDYLFSNKYNGRIFIEAGNGVPQSFRTSYIKLGHTVEVADNITFTATAAQLRYSWLKPEDHPNEKPSYTTFVPEVELQYRKNGYPTVTLGYAHSIKGIIGSDVEFGRAELDIQHKIDVGPMHSLTYRAGFGIAFDYNYLYFVQFKNLRDNHLPHGWDDDIGGTFNLLSSVKYNEIDKYLRANVQYDAPLLLVPTLLRKVKFITKERLYCNLLLVDTMSPYVEMGYGIGTNIFNMGVFWGGEVDKWDRIGVKFTFEIFN